MLHARVEGHRGCQGGRLRLVAGALLTCLLLAACGVVAAKPERPPHPVGLASLLRMQPQRASVTLLPGTPPHLSSLHFVNSQDGWIGGQGVILATSNGGASWHRQYLGTGNVTGFSFLSPTLGFAATSAGLLKTDNGKTWTRVDAQSLYRVQFFSASEGFALEGQSQSYPATHSLVATSDGGKSWRLLASGAVAQACFVGSRIGIATLTTGMGGTLTVERTTDGGVNWSTALSIQGAVPVQLQCTQDGGAWLVAAGWASMSQQSYSVFRSADAGASWNVVIAVSTAGAGPAPGKTAGAAAGPGSSPGPIVALDRTTAIMTGTCEACGDGTAGFSTTTDGGATWSPVTQPIPLQPSAPSTLDMLTAQAGWLLASPGPGRGQEIRETTDGGAVWHTVLSFGPPTPTVATAFVNGRIGYGIGATGDALAVLQTQDGGQTWRKAGDLPPEAMFTDAVAAAEDGRLFALGNSVVYESTTGGRTWVRLNRNTLPAVDAISFATPKTGCAGSSDHTTRNGGKTWRRTGMQGVPVAVCAISLTDPALAKEAIQLIDRLAPNDASSATYSLSTVAAGGGSLWIALANENGPNGRLYVLSSGKPPRVVLWPERINVSSMSPVSAGEAYITTSDGRLLVTRDGGRSWTQIR